MFVIFNNKNIIFSPPIKISIFRELLNSFFISYLHSFRNNFSEFEANLVQICWSDLLHWAWTKSPVDIFGQSVCSRGFALNAHVKGLSNTLAQRYKSSWILFGQTSYTTDWIATSINAYLRWHHLCITSVLGWNL